MDLSLFQFDYDLTWAIFFLNADRTLYGRFGSRDDYKEAARAISVEGLRKAMQGALELHAGYPANKKELAGKSGPAPAFRTPEAIPEHRGKKNMKPADGTRGGCVHCHNAHDTTAWSLRNGRQPIPDRVLFMWPMPDVVGLAMDPAERATVASVTAGSPGEKSGFKAGDRILRFEGQPILSIADLQWVLQVAKDSGALKAEVEREGKKSEVTLTLPAGWRQKADFGWREWSWSVRHRLMGTEKLQPLGADQKKGLGLPEGGMALKMEKMPPDWVQQKNPDAKNVFQPGDVIVGADGRRDFVTEAQLLAYVMQRKPSGSTLEFQIMRGGKIQKASLKIP